ncbi:POC1 centriolar protein A, partial [Ceratobasidium sp. 414]
VMNLTKSMQHGVEILGHLLEWDERLRHVTETKELVEDAYEFARAFSSSPASRSTPHIYISSLSFWPRQRPVSRHYLQSVRSLVEPMASAVQRSGSMPLGIYDVGNIITCTAFSGDGRRIVSGSFHGTIHIWDVDAGRTLGRPFIGHAGAVRSVMFSADSTRVISGSLDGTIRIWDAGTGAPVGVPLISHTGAVLSVALSSDGSRIVSGSADKTVRIWSTNSIKPPGVLLGGHTGAVCAVAFSPEPYPISSTTVQIWNATGVGYRIVSGSEDMTVRIWSASTGAPVGKPLTGHTGAVYSVAFSPDGSHVVSGSEDNTARIWDVESGRPVNGLLAGHAGAVYSVAFSPDGSRVVSGSADKTIRIWDVRNSRAVGMPLQGHTDQVYWVSYSPDMRLVGSWSADNTIRLWNVGPKQPTCKTLKWHTAHLLVYSTEHTRIAHPEAGPNLVWGTSAGHLNWTREPHGKQAEMTIPPSCLVCRHAGPNDCNDVCIKDILTLPTARSSRAELFEPVQVFQTPIDTSGSAGPSGGFKHPESITCSLCCRWAFDEEGWVVMCSSRRLIWVPADIRDLIWHPAGTVEIPEQNSLWIDLN